jgi:hypothetical protein
MAATVAVSNGSSVQVCIDKQLCAGMSRQQVLAEQASYSKTAAGVRYMPV